MHRFTPQHPSTAYRLTLIGVQGVTEARVITPTALAHLDMGGR